MEKHQRSFKVVNATYCALRNIWLLYLMHMEKYCKRDEIIYLQFICFSPQDDKDTTSNKESLDDLFPAEDEEQSQSK